MGVWIQCPNTRSNDTNCGLWRFMRLVCRGIVLICVRTWQWHIQKSGPCLVGVIKYIGHSTSRSLKFKCQCHKSQLTWHGRVVTVGWVIINGANITNSVKINQWNLRTQKTVIHEIFPIPTSSNPGPWFCYPGVVADMHTTNNHTHIPWNSGRM